MSCASSRLETKSSNPSRRISPFRLVDTLILVLKHGRADSRQPCLGNAPWSACFDKAATRQDVLFGLWLQRKDSPSWISGVLYTHRCFKVETWIRPKVFLPDTVQVINCRPEDDVYVICCQSHLIAHGKETE